MVVLKEGYIYELRNYEDKTLSQTVKFISKKKSNDNNVYSVVTDDGTTSEEVVTMLIHRIKYLNKLKPSSFNKLAIKYLNEALSALTMRKQSKIETHAEARDSEQRLY